MIAVFLKEFHTFLSSLIAYMVLGVFLLATGLLVWVFPDTSVLEYGYAELDTLFAFAPYVLLFLSPAISMRMLAEERKMGTIELLLTRPLRDSEIVLGKYLSAACLVLLAILPTLIYYVSLYLLSSPQGNVDSAGILGSYLSLFLLGAAFAAIGLFASALTENQIVAFLLAVFLCFLFYTGFSSLAALDLWGTTGYVVQQLGMEFHYQALSKGLIDSRPLVYFFSLVILFLFATKTVLASRRW